jgi:hypothetical protein
MSEFDELAELTFDELTHLRTTPEGQRINELISHLRQDPNIKNDLLIHIPPERLARWKKRYPIHWREMIDMLEADLIIQRGGAPPRFIVQACYRTWELFLGMYDLATPEKDKPKTRWRFRQLLAEYPQTDKYFPHFRQRLGEHAMFVKHGMEELDPDEIEGGCDA